MLLRKEKESGLGSDGETSDYQRSTPSPRDGNSRIPELSTEGTYLPPEIKFTKLQVGLGPA